MFRRKGVKDFSGRKCLVTGAASGIGRATALQLAREGAEVVLVDIQAEALEALADEISGGGGRVLWSGAVDIADAGAVAAIADEIHAEHGAMDAIFHVAGVSTWGTINSLENEHWKRLIDINLMGTIHVVDSFLTKMVDAGRPGAFAVVASAAALIGLPWHAAYSASKFGMRGINEVLRFDLARHGITVHTVCPGAVDTPLVRSVEIVGVDMEDPKAQGAVAHFRKKAVSTETAAARMISGVRRNRYIVYTSLDIRLVFWAQRFFPPGYTTAMRVIGWYIHRLAAGQEKRLADR